MLGVLTVEQIAGGENSPFGLRHALAHARDRGRARAQIAAQLPRLLVALLDAGSRRPTSAAC